ncbi:Arrestin domain-containing protein A [Phytophthora cinnamomi]|uniref:Arrestin domain-containing protein A n=1 Tax=Phytophthora cinnamomi TaxID=4785 RepID=UPI00355A232D|nr:Arrestin domain-containing protein A [Phytophthora cinnamomi]
MAYSHTILRNARSGNVKWTLRVALDRDTYHAGDILQANVFLCVVEPVHCNGIVGFVRGEEKITWSEKSPRRAVGEEIYSQLNEFLSVKMIVAKPRMYGPGEYIFPVGVVVEAQQEIILQEAVLPARPLMGLDVVPAPVHVVQPGVAPQDNDPFLSTSLDKPAYRSGDTLRVQCRVNSRSGGGEAFSAFLRLYEDINLTVAPSKRSEGSRLLYERRFPIAAGAASFDLALELAAGPQITPSLERSFCSSFVERRHRLAVECVPLGSNSVTKSEMAIVIL